MQKEYDKKTNL